MKMERMVIVLAILWMAASLWLANNGDPAWIWMGLLPAVYILFLNILRD